MYTYRCAVTTREPGPPRHRPARGGAAARIGTDISEKCAALGVDLSIAFPPCASANAAALHTGLADAAAVQPCVILDAADALGVTCP